MNIAFAGFRHSHIFALYDRAKQTEGICVVGAWENDDAAREAAQQQVSEPFYTSYDELLADPAVEAVAVGDYYSVRGNIIIRALEAGKHVIADKPLCTSMQELTKIRALAKEKKLKVACMLDLRYNPSVRMARRMVREGKLGKIHAVNFTGQHPLSYGIRPGWYFEAGKHGGTINDIAIHGIDAVRYITGLEYVKTTAARTWNAFAKEAPFFNDCAQFMAEFEGGAGVTADVSYAAQTKTASMMPGYWRFTLWGEEGCAEFRISGGKLLYAGRDSQSPEEIICPPTGENYLTDFMKPYSEEALEDILASAQTCLSVQEAADMARKG